MRYSKVIVAVSIAVTTLFTAAVLLASVAGADVPDSLIYCVYGMYGIELASCAGIKINKDRHGAETPRVALGGEDEEQDSQ